jgi:hypothetical protein
MKKFVERMSEFVTQAESLNVNVIHAGALTIYPPFEVGEDFVAGNSHQDGSGHTTAIRYAAIATVWPLKANRPHG